MRWAPLLLAVLLLAGCGAAEVTAQQAVRQAQERTAEAQTYRFTVAAPGLRAEGAVDARAERSRLSADGHELIVAGDVLYVRHEGRWLSADVTGLGTVLGGKLAELPRVERLLDRLRDAGAVERSGREEVRGVETTRYSGEQLAVWVDDDGLVRRVRAGAMTAELYDFGADVEIEPPPPDQVTSLADLLGRSP